MKPDLDDDTKDDDEERQEQKSPNENGGIRGNKSRLNSENVSRELVFPVVFKLR